MSDYTMAAVEDIPPEMFDRAGIEGIALVDELDADRLRPRVWSLDPGDAVTYHRQTEQEELYVLLQGPGRMRIGDELLDVREWTAVCVPPETPRQILNDTDTGPHVWLVVATPAVEADGQHLGEPGEMVRPEE